MLEAGLLFPTRLLLFKETTNNRKSISAKCIVPRIHRQPRHALVISEAGVLERLPSTRGSGGLPLGARHPQQPTPPQSSFLSQTGLGFITSFMATSGAFPLSSCFLSFLFKNPSSKVISVPFSSIFFLRPPHSPTPKPAPTLPLPFLVLLAFGDSEAEARGLITHS